MSAKTAFAFGSVSVSARHVMSEATLINKYQGAAILLMILYLFAENRAFFLVRLGVF